MQNNGKIQYESLVTNCDWKNEGETSIEMNLICFPLVIDKANTFFGLYNNIKHMRHFKIRFIF